MATRDLDKMILSEVGMTQESLEDGVKHIREWLSKQPHLPNITDEKLLKGFIVGSKSVERSKERLDKYFTARAKYPTLLGNRDPACIQWHQVERLSILPGLTSQGYTVLMIRVPTAKEEVEAFSFVESVRACLMLVELTLRAHPVTAGQVIAVDCQGVSMELLVKFISLHTQAAFNIYENTLPIRMKACICVNVPSLAESFCNTVLKMFFSEKLQKRFSVHSDAKILTEYIPLEMLPKEYGGNNPTIQQLFEETKRTLSDAKDWLLGDGSAAADESKRPKSEASSDDIHGTFRKLQID